jgi:hypothetical protein
MSEQEFESYLRLLARFLNLSGNQRTAIALELRTHMEDQLDELMARGFTREEAIQTALDEFGDAAALAGESGKIGRTRRWIMRTTTMFAVAAAVLLVSFLLPQHTAWVPAPAVTQAGEKMIKPPTAATVTRPAEVASYTESEVDRAAREKLTMVLSTVDLAEGTTLADAIDYLRLQGQLSLNVNWAALALINIERTTETDSLNLRDVKLGTVLDIVLDNVSLAAGGVGRATYDVMDGIIRVSTQEELNSRTVVRAYECSDLIGQPLTPSQKDTLAVFSIKVRTSRTPARSAHPNRPQAAAPESEDQAAASRPAAGPEAVLLSHSLPRYFQPCAIETLRNC